MNFKSIVNTAVRTANRGLLQVKKYAPEILTVTAVVTGIAATATAIERTLKIDDVLAEIDHDQESLKKMRAYKDEGIVTEEQYSEEELMQAKVVYGAKAALLMVKHYRVPISLTIASVGSAVGSYTILKKRYMGAVAAYMAAQTTFEAYRAEVREKEGEEGENLLFKNVTKKMEDEQDKLTKAYEEATGKKAHKNAYNVSQYARWFDEASRYWKKYPGANGMFVRSQEKYWNDILRIRGHVFLNEVYDSLDIPRTTAGAVVGWVYNPTAEGPQIDFGLLDGSIERYRAFINGTEPNVLLDFNVDGVIYDLI